MRNKRPNADNRIVDVLRKFIADRLATLYFGLADKIIGGRKPGKVGHGLQTPDDDTRFHVDRRPLAAGPLASFGRTRLGRSPTTGQSQPHLARYAYWTPLLGATRKIASKFNVGRQPSHVPSRALGPRPTTESTDEPSAKTHVSQSRPCTCSIQHSKSLFFNKQHSE